MIIVVMGVSGCGKTTFAELLQEKLGWPLVEADEHHSEANKAKMEQGIPLNDKDRLPWLMSLGSVIKGWQDSGQSGIMTCSALKRVYRDILLTGGPGEGDLGATDMTSGSQGLDKSNITTETCKQGKKKDGALSDCADLTESSAHQSQVSQSQPHDLNDGVSCGGQGRVGEPGVLERLDRSREVVFVHLYGPLEVVRERLGERKGHFMPASLLQSQYQTLEMPDPAQEPVIQLSVQNSQLHNVRVLCRDLGIGADGE